MKHFAILSVAALYSGALALPSTVELNKWETFKAVHGKQHSPSQDAVRMAKFLQRSAEIEAHNARFEAGLESFSLKLNQYSDLSSEEFAKVALGYTPSNETIPLAGSLEEMPSLPESLDYRTMNVMTPVRDQGACGSCYAFAASAALESYLLRTTGNAYDLSEQDVVDCSFKKFMGLRENNGCQGGHPTAVFDYYNQKDIVMESSYRYVSGRTGTHYGCQAPSPVYNFIQRRLKPRRVRLNEESDLKQYLVRYGPVVIGIAADTEHKALFRDLGNGIFDDEDTIKMDPNHNVVVSGYGSENGKDYWIIKNSWGTSWGDGGYGKIAANKNMANIMPSGIWYLE